ncbi:aldo/keto reductase [Dactylosporangium cerinum]|uniref:Aldo/keto reductase n=1 Tax=Dactylosporangium cerinum TaxID=1434730 RepID=A0ABV9W993_9ACTN
MSRASSAKAHDAEPLLPVVEELGIGFVAYSPLARGFLSGAVKSREHYGAADFRQLIPWWAPENFDQNVAIVSELTKFAETRDATLAQLALAWLLAKKDSIVPIPGSRNPGRVAQNIAAVDLALTADDLAHIDAIAPTGGIGNRR